jgi:hypothetical protein
MIGSKDRNKKRCADVKITDVQMKFANELIGQCANKKGQERRPNYAKKASLDKQQTAGPLL